MIRLTRLIGIVGAMALAGCTMQTAGTPVQTAAPSPPETAPTAPSQTSAALAAYYAATESRLRAQGLLRTDGGGPDTPITARSLAANFERIALFDEYTVSGGRFIAKQSESRLRRWSSAIRMRPVFGASVPEAQRTKDLRDLTAYAARLSRVTGVPITVTDAGKANYHVLFLNADEQRQAAPLLRELVPGIGTPTVRDIVNMQRYTFCSVYAFSERLQPYNYVAAVAVVKSEHPDLLRLSCIHEEIAQGLGLANDSPMARPSIFNDDEEFALLTRHDELLLSMLYDPRLRTGMTATEARPIVEQIAREKLSGS